MPGNLSLGSKRSHKIIIVVIYCTKNDCEKLLLLHFHLFPFALLPVCPACLPPHQNMSVYLLGGWAPSIDPHTALIYLPLTFSHCTHFLETVKRINKIQPDASCPRLGCLYVVENLTCCRIYGEPIKPLTQLPDISACFDRSFFFLINAT